MNLVYLFQKVTHSGVCFMCVFLCQKVTHSGVCFMCVRVCVCLCQKVTYSGVCFMCACVCVSMSESDTFWGCVLCVCVCVCLHYCEATHHCFHFSALEVVSPKLYAPTAGAGATRIERSEISLRTSFKEYICLVKFPSVCHVSP